MRLLQIGNGGGGEGDNHGGEINDNHHYENDGATPGQNDNQPQYYEDNEEGENGQPQYEDHYEDDGNGGFSVTKRLVGSRIARKQAEDDVKLLANRIALLKMEEQKVSISNFMKANDLTRKLCASFLPESKRSYRLWIAGELSAQRYSLNIGLEKD